MAKTYLSTLFFCCFFMLQHSVGASNHPFTPKTTKPETSECNAPAPTNFRITSASSNFISLAWSPAWIGATHTLAVLESDGQGGWIGVDTLHNVPDSAFTVDDLTAGQTYRFFLATNCDPDNPSQLKTSIDGITLILDLLIVGRIPMAPKAPTDCFDIPLNVHWSGFQVSYAEEDEYLENQFELGFGGSSANSGFGSFHFLVKRVGLFNPIVAAELNTTDSPDCIEPKIEAEATFKIKRFINGGPQAEIAGIVDMVLHNDPPRFSVCPRVNHPHFPWKSNYTLTGLISARSGRPLECGERSLDNVEEYRVPSVQNPFQNQLKLSFEHSVGQEERVRVRLVNTSGQMVLDQEFSAVGGALMLGTEHLPAGLYVLQIEQGNYIKAFKVVKSE